MSASTFELAHPAVLALLLSLPAWGLWRWRAQRLDLLSVAPLQHQPTPGRRRLLATLLVPLELALLAACIVTLAGPRSVDRLERLDGDGIDVMLVLDVSLSMLAEDFPPNRLAAMRQLSGELVARADGHRVGVVVFAGDAYVQSPLTTDTLVLRRLLDEVGAPMLSPGRSGGTALGDALLVGAERLAAAEVPGRDQAVVLITDGESNLGVDPVLVCRRLAEDGVRLYAIGVGGTEPVAVAFEGERVGGDDAYMAVLDDAQLRAMVAAAGGEEAGHRFFRATDVGTLEAVFDELSRLESAPLEVTVVELQRSHGPWWAQAALSLFAAHLLLAGVVARRPYR